MAIERIMIVDDAEQNLLFFNVLLKEIGFNKCSTSTNGAEALEIIEQQHIQFVITAWEMGPIPGTVFVQKARSKKNKKYLPCLIYSKRMNDGDINLTKELGFDSVLSMPFDREKAKDLIKRMIAAEEALSPLEKQLRKLEFYLLDNRPSEALKLVDSKTLTKGEFYARAQTLVAEIWFRLMKYDKADLHLSEALKDNPDYFPALQLKTQLLSKQGKQSEAIAILVEMSKKSPNNLTTLVNLGCAYVETEQFDKAKETFGKVNALDSSNTELKQGQAKMAFRQGDLSLASQLISELESGDEMARYFNNMAISMVVMGDCERGIATYQNAMKVLADKAKLHLLHYNLGLAWKKKGDIEKALKEFCQSYIVEPRYEKAYNSVARTVRDLRKSGKKYDQKVVDELKRARKNFKSADAVQQPAKKSA